MCLTISALGRRLRRQTTHTIHPQLTVCARLMDLRFVELVGLSALADMRAIVALMHGQVFLPPSLGLLWGLRELS
jgi:hypothetical protein